MSSFRERREKRGMTTREVGILLRIPEMYVDSYEESGALPESIHPQHTHMIGPPSRKEALARLSSLNTRWTAEDEGLVPTLHSPTPHSSSS